MTDSDLAIVREALELICQDSLEMSLIQVQTCPRDEEISDVFQDLLAALDRLATRLGVAEREREEAESGRVGRYFEMVDRAEAAEARVRELEHYCGHAIRVEREARVNFQNADANWQRCMEAERERDSARHAAEEQFQSVGNVGALLGCAEAREAALTKAIDLALHELGAPNEDYPAPVANAVEILEAAIDIRAEA